ncbi:hypothetical protein [Trueperella sp. LYQ141]|uniref:hypothetical protein n=1 Tax=Trueperella sp. LYQ141 TaxID=3391058 RepID=UPI00398331FD
MMTYKKNSLRLVLRDLPCDIRCDPQVAGIELAMSEPLRAYFRYEEDADTLSIIQTRGFWEQRRPHIFDVLRKRKIVVTVGVPLNELQVQVGAGLRMNGVHIGSGIFRVDNGSVELRNTIFRSAECAGSSCSFHAKDVSIADQLVVDIKNGSFTWEDAPGNAGVDVHKSIGRVTFYGKEMRSGQSTQSARKPRLSISCDGGSVKLGKS